MSQRLESLFVSGPIGNAKSERLRHGSGKVRRAEFSLKVGRKIMLITSCKRQRPYMVLVTTYLFKPPFRTNLAYLNYRLELI
jgi:hypothetical protein